MRVVCVYVCLGCVWCDVRGHQEKGRGHRKRFSNIKSTRDVESMWILPDAEQCDDCKDWDDVYHSDDSREKDMSVIVHLLTSTESYCFCSGGLENRVACLKIRKNASEQEMIAATPETMMAIV